MTPWLTLSLGLWLGQTPEITSPLPPGADVQDPAAIELREAWERALQNVDATDEGQDSTEGTAVQMPALDVGAAGTGGSGPAETSDSAQPQAQGTTGSTQGDVAQLRAQVQALQTQVDSLQQQLTGMRDNATELERMRQQRLEEIERAGTWLIAADQALAVGELAIGNALQEADAALALVIQSATEAGSGRTVILVEGARGAILRALEATGRRDTSQARWDLFYAAEHLREARRHNLDEPSATTITR